MIVSHNNERIRRREGGERLIADRRSAEID